MSTETQRKRIEEVYNVAVDRGPKGIWNVSLTAKDGGQLVAVFYGRGEIIAMDLAHTFAAAKNLHERLRECTAENQELRDQLKLASAPLPPPPEEIATVEAVPDEEDPADLEPDEPDSGPKPLPGVSVSSPAMKLLKAQDLLAEEVADAIGKKRLTLHDVQRYLRARGELIETPVADVVNQPAPATS